jgi:mRNA-degrading endonuclease RelE of RelBE toxin-antitoxin system
LGPPPSSGVTRSVLLSESADREYSRLPARARERIHAAFLSLANAERGDVKRLKGTRGREDLYRLRVGDYRVVFAPSESEIRVTRILLRSEGCDWL